MRKKYIIRDTSGPAFRTLVQTLASLASEQVPDCDVLVVSASQQLAIVQEHMPVAINLDPFSRVSGHHPLDVCRVFSTHKDTLVGFSSRPGTPPLEEQLKALPAGNFVLMDDDICSGSTIAFVTQELARVRPDISICGTWSLAHSWLESIGENKNSLYDIIDSHDFIDASTTSGLVVSDGHTLKRLMYHHLAVDLSKRAKFTNPHIFRQKWMKALQHFSSPHFL